MRNLHALAVLVSLVAASPAAAWEGINQETGNSVVIDKGNLVRPGLTIEVYAAGSGDYKDVDVQSMQDTGSGVEIEVYDNDTGETQTLEMEN